MSKNKRSFSSKVTKALFNPKPSIATVSKPLVQVFKYTKEIYASAMLEKGSIRLGTLYEYRDSENEQIKDIEEGLFNGKQHIDFHMGALPGIAGEMIMGNVDGVEFSNVSFTKRMQVFNVNIYCTTLEGSKEVMESFEAEACIEIFDYNSFVKSIVIALMRKGLSRGQAFTDKCSYDGRDAPYNQVNAERVPVAYWLKNPFYNSQKEQRTLFPPYPDDRLIEPIYIDVPEIIPFIRRYNF
jgi:hypothetical protein